MSLVGSLLLLQGYVGWWMIKSGLYPEESTKKHFTGMSQYRIFTHLTLSSIIFSITLWTGLGQLIKPENHNNVAKICTFRSFALASFISIFITTCYGAFVSGTHSGDI
uniref:Cytochrome b561 domain-containing protein n=1 Tax=Panagrolaimus sp. JU765 TaxID=591449 RepID=A0AC34RJ71_9BILA